VIVDLAAEKGGNCELTKPDEDVVVDGVTIIGHTNLPSEVPAHASQMYARNLITFLEHLFEEGAIQLDFADEITAGTIVSHQGRIVNPRLGGTLPEMPAQPAETARGES